MSETRFAERFFGMLASDRCPDCGGNIVALEIKEEGPEGGDGLTEFVCDSCPFKLVSCGQIHEPALACKCPRCGGEMTDYGSECGFDDNLDGEVEDFSFECDVCKIGVRIETLNGKVISGQASPDLYSGE